MFFSLNIWIKVCVSYYSFINTPKLLQQGNMMDKIVLMTTYKNIKHENIVIPLIVIILYYIWI